MHFSKRLDNLISAFTSLFTERYLFLRKYFSEMLCILLLGFLVGNMFASIMSTVRKDFVWDGFVGITLIIFVEVVSYLTYHAQDRPFLFFVISSRELNRVFWRFFNIFKIGLIFGFFVDAFKVAS